MCMPWSQEQWRGQVALGNAVIVGEYTNGQNTALLAQDSGRDVYIVYPDDTSAFWFRTSGVEAQIALARQELEKSGYKLIQATTEQETSETASASA